MATPEKTLIGWFSNGKKPDENQFKAWLESYWHKEASIPIGNIAGISDILVKKADKEALDTAVNTITQLINSIKPGASIDDSLEASPTKTYSITKIRELINSIWTTVEDLYSDIDKKVEKEEGKGLSEANFTQQEKDKLAGLSLKYQGNYTSLGALKNEKPEGENLSSAWNPNKEGGYYADVDEGKGKEVTRYIWDTNDYKWVPLLGSSSMLNASEVKTLYESNSDTNAFTDEQKTRVNDLASLNQWAGETDPLKTYINASTNN